MSADLPAAGSGRSKADLIQDLALCKHRLQMSEEELLSFSYAISHDLRAPLRGIDGWSMALSEDCGAQLDEKGREYLDRLRGETKRMHGYLESLLNLSRIFHLDMDLSEVDLTAMAQSIARDLRQSQPGRAAQWEIQAGMVVQADPAMLRSALAHLLENSWKFTGKRESAEIRFSILPPSGESGQGPAVFCVSDNGAGFDMAYAKKLFSPFQRMHKSRDFPGMGMGLAMAHRIIRRHGGKIWAESRIDRGASFFFTLSSPLKTLD